MRQIYKIICPGSLFCPNVELEQEIGKVDKISFSEQEGQVGNPIDFFSKIIRAIKIVQI